MIVESKLLRAPLEQVPDNKAPKCLWRGRWPAQFLGTRVSVDWISASRLLRLDEKPSETKGVWDTEDPNPGRNLVKGEI